MHIESETSSSEVFQSINEVRGKIKELGAQIETLLRSHRNLSKRRECSHILIRMDNMKTQI